MEKRTPENTTAGKLHRARVVFLWVVLITSALLINLYFLHNSHFFYENFGSIGLRIDTFVVGILLPAQGKLFGWGSIHVHTISFRIFKDIETLGLGLLIMFCSFLLT